MYHFTDWWRPESPNDESELRRFASRVGAQFVPAKRGILDNMLADNPYKVIANCGVWAVTFDNAVQVNSRYGISYRRWYTRVRVPYYTQDGLRFRLQPRGFVSDLMSFLGVPEVRTGERAFDRYYLVRAADHRRARDLFMNARIRKLLLETRRFDANEGLRVPSLRRLLVLNNVSPGPLRASLPAGIQVLFAESDRIAAAEELALFLDLFQELLQQLVHIGSATDKNPAVIL